MARHFYVDAVGLREISKPASLRDRGGFWIAAGSLEVHLGIDADFKPARKAHVALLIEDLDELRIRLGDHGFEPGPIEFELSGFRRCYVDDPFGNRVELMQSL